MILFFFKPAASNKCLANVVSPIKRRFSLSVVDVVVVVVAAAVVVAVALLLLLLLSLLFRACTKKKRELHEIDRH